MMKNEGFELAYIPLSDLFTASALPRTPAPATETTTGPARSKQRI